jgi:hypothetical protein
MNGLGSAVACRRDNAVDSKVAVGAGRAADSYRLIAGGDMSRRSVGIGIHGDRPDPQATCRGCHAAADFAAVRDQQGAKHQQVVGKLLREPIASPIPS